ncbi:MAG: ABC transporter ATP-binding protein [Bacteroidales bacterium]|nr:ABC transporter ATP-binding protein [Bacteroidales bacterium]
MIKTSNLSYAYVCGQPVLDQISLELPSGHVLGLLGRNGIGKSTLLKLLSGALLGEGEYFVGGRDPRKREAAFQQSIRLVPENEALFDITIADYAKVTRPLYPTFSDEILSRALAEFQVPSDKKLTDMSLGQQKKALVSLSLACNTPYLFMDEPTNGMDILSKSSFRKLVAGMIDEERTIVISTHQVDDLVGLMDYVTIMENNGILLSDSLENIGQQYGTEDIKQIFCQLVTNK